MQRRKLGELEVSAIGLGCATMTPFYGEPDPAAAIATLERAAEIGVDFARHRRRLWQAAATRS